jgi:hypothetical protein
MALGSSLYSLTSALRERGDAATIARRRQTKNAANQRNRDNRRAIGAWHNQTRGKMQEVPFPERRHS